jgi:hypothetical protein
MRWRNLIVACTVLVGRGDEMQWEVIDRSDRGGGYGGSGYANDCIEERHELVLLETSWLQ